MILINKKAKSTSSISIATKLRSSYMPLNNSILDSNNNYSNNQIPKNTPPNLNHTTPLSQSPNSKMHFFKVGSWNVAGLKTRSAASNNKISFLHSIELDIICLQETHANIALSKLLTKKFNSYHTE